MDAAPANFTAVVCLDGALTNFQAGVFLWLSAGTERPPIFRQAFLRLGAWTEFLVARCLRGALANFLADVFCGTVPGRSARRFSDRRCFVALCLDSARPFSGRRFLWLGAWTERPPIFWQSFFVARCVDGALAHFPAVFFDARCLDGVLANFLAGVFCGTVPGRSTRPFSGRFISWLGAWTERPPIFWQAFFVALRLDGALANFLAGVFLWLGAWTGRSPIFWEAFFCGLVPGRSARSSSDGRFLWLGAWTERPPIF